MKLAEITLEGGRLVVCPTREPYQYDLKMLAKYWLTFCCVGGLGLYGFMLLPQSGSHTFSFIRPLPSVFAFLLLITLAFAASVVYVSQGAAYDIISLDRTANHIFRNGVFLSRLDNANMMLQTGIGIGKRGFRLSLFLPNGSEMTIVQTPLVATLEEQQHYFSEIYADRYKYGYGLGPGNPAFWHEYQGEQTGFSKRDTDIFEIAEKITEYADIGNSLALTGHRTDA